MIEQVTYTNAVLPQQAAACLGVFHDSFSASEGAEEGQLIADLAAALFRTSPVGTIDCHIAMRGGRVVGAIIWSAFSFEGSTETVKLLSPVAVLPEAQGQGVGQALIRFGLAQMKASGAQIAVTYGDPAFYGQVGFAQVSVSDLPSPYPLSHPHGWLAQSLTAVPMPVLSGPSRTVPAFADPAYW